MAGDRNVRIASLLAKVESVIGTDASPVAGNAVLLTDPIADPGGMMVVKTARPHAVTGYIQPLADLTPRGRFSTWQLKTQMRGTRDGLFYQASDLPDIDPLLQAAGLSSTVGGGSGTEIVTYAPLSTSMKSATLYYYLDGKVSKLLGCVVSSVKLSVKAGGPLEIEFTVEGLYQGQTDTSYVAPTIGSAIPPTSDNVAFTLFGYSAGIVRSFECTITNETTGARPSINSTNAIVSPRVRSRKISYTAVLENELVATKDFEAAQVANTLGALSFTVGGTQYNKMEVSAPQAQIEDVKYSNDKMTDLATITGQFVDSSGNDAVSLIFQ